MSILITMPTWLGGKGSEPKPGNVRIKKDTPEYQKISEHHTQMAPMPSSGSVKQSDITPEYLQESWDTIIANAREDGVYDIDDELEGLIEEMLEAGFSTRYISFFLSFNNEQELDRLILKFDHWSEHAKIYQFETDVLEGIAEADDVIGATFKAFETLESVALSDERLKGLKKVSVWIAERSPDRFQFGFGKYYTRYHRVEVETFRVTMEELANRSKNSKTYAKKEYDEASARVDAALDKIFPDGSDLIAEYMQARIDAHAQIQLKRANNEEMSARLRTQARTHPNSGKQLPRIGEAEIKEAMTALRNAYEDAMEKHILVETRTELVQAHMAEIEDQLERMYEAITILAMIVADLAATFRWVRELLAMIGRYELSILEHVRETGAVMAHQGKARMLRESAQALTDGEGNETAPPEEE